MHLVLMSKWFRLHEALFKLSQFQCFGSWIRKRSVPRHCPVNPSPTKREVLIPTETSSLVNWHLQCNIRLCFETGIIFISTNSVHRILGILSASSTGNICLGTACGKWRYVFLTRVEFTLGFICVFRIGGGL